MSSLAHDAADGGLKQELPEPKAPNNARSSQTWHQMFLQQSPSSSQLSFISEMPTDGGSQFSTPKQARQPNFGDLDESGTNYDSGNFSLSEAGVKEKFVSSAGLHQRFLQLNTELYQTKTELLTYKYKWNEIRNEIELDWSKKLEKISDEKNSLLMELDDLRQAIARLMDTSANDKGRELLRIRSELQDVTVRLECKNKANEYLKQKITEQHIEKEHLSMRIKNLERNSCEEHSEMCRLKASEQWFRDALHRCQNENAKLKESCETLHGLLRKEQAVRRALAEQNTVLSKAGLQHEIASKEKEHDVKMLQQEIALLNETHHRNESKHREEKALLERQNAELNDVIQQLRQTVEEQIQKHTETLAGCRKEALRVICPAHVGPEGDEMMLNAIRRYRNDIETLGVQLARECFHKRQIDVSVEKLKAQVKVLSINLASRAYQRKAVEESELRTIRERNRELQEQCNCLINQKQELQNALNMYSGRQGAQIYEEKLLKNFRTIQSKNLDLELKLGQCVEIGMDENVGAYAPSGSETVPQKQGSTKRLKKDVSNLEQTVADSGLLDQRDKDGKLTSRCPKHGLSCRAYVGNVTTIEDENDEMRNLRIVLKAIESENRRHLQRYEINNRTLLQQVKRYSRERNQAKQQVEALETEHSKCAKLRNEMATTRERCLLLEADLEEARQEANILRGEKQELILLLQNNCLLTCDGDVWGSIKLAVKDLRDLPRIRKENVRFREQIETDARTIQQLEATAEEWKLAAEQQKVNKDVLHREVTPGNVDHLSDEKSLQQQDNEKDLSEKLVEMDQLLRIQSIRLETAHERLKLFEEAELMLTASSDMFFKDLQLLQDAILAEKQEKYELEEEVYELREKMISAVGNSLQNFQPTNSSNGSVRHTATTASPDPQSLSSSPPASLDIDHLQALVDECSQRKYSLQPLDECVSSLKLEMGQLSSVLQLGDYSLLQQQQRRQPMIHPRIPLSLMDELNDATNGRYGSR